MIKLKLDFEHLTVESFDTAPHKQGAMGTVHARESDELRTDEAACHPNPGTYWATCYEVFGCMDTGGSGAVCCPSGDTCSCDATSCDVSCVYGSC